MIEEDILNSVMQEKGDVSESEEEAETSDSVSEKSLLTEALNEANDLWVLLVGIKMFRRM